MAGYFMDYDALGHLSLYLIRLVTPAQMFRFPPAKLLAVPRRMAQAAEEMAPAASSRLAVRLAELSHVQLLELAVAGCEASSEVKNRADAILAVHKPLAQWAVEGVLLSSDLVPHLLAPLQLENGAAAAVCSRWADGWNVTSEGRRRLTRVAFDFPEDLLGTDGFKMAVIPGDNEQLVVHSSYRTHILDRNMNTVASFFLEDDDDHALSGPIAADAHSIYACVEGAPSQVRRFTHDDGTRVASYQFQEGYQGYGPVLAPGGLLFCVCYRDAGLADSDRDEIIALDSQTLQFRYRFGLSLLKDALCLTVVGEELFVCDRGNGRLQVFSLAGEHRRSITGEWKHPAGLLSVMDRLYLVEYDPSSANNVSYKGRIFVLSLQGDTLQIYRIPFELMGCRIDAETLLCFDGKLLVTLMSVGSETANGMVALIGV